MNGNFQKRWTDEQAMDIAKSIAHRMLGDYLERAKEGYDGTEQEEDDIDPWFNHASREGGCRICCGGELSMEETEAAMLDCPSVDQIGDAIRDLMSTIDRPDWRTQNAEKIEYGDALVITEGRYAGQIGAYDDDADAGIYYVILCDGQEVLVAACNVRLASDSERQAWASVATAAIGKWAGAVPKGDVQ